MTTPKKPARKAATKRVKPVVKDKAQSDYAEGYRAGAEHRSQGAADALWCQFMVAALGGCVHATGYRVNDQPISGVDSRAQLAAHFADAALKQAQNRGRV